MNFMLQICSGSLPSNQTEIYCHVYESYYCMPVPTYAFEWGACDLISLFPSFSFFFLLFPSFHLRFLLFPPLFMLIVGENW